MNPKSILGAILFIAGILALAWVINVYRQKKSSGGDFSLDDILSQPTKSGFAYRNGKCYEVKINSITGSQQIKEVEARYCYSASGFAESLQTEWQNNANRLASLPNPNDPNEPIWRAQLTTRNQQIVRILREIKNCPEPNNFDVATLACTALNPNV